MKLGSQVVIEQALFNLIEGDASLCSKAFEVYPDE